MNAVGARALVLGGGGVTGIGWEVGLLAGLAELGLDLSDADTVIGTSAGSVVGGQVTSGHPLSELYDRQIAGYGPESVARLGPGFRARFAWALLRGRAGPGFRRRIGAMAMKAATVSEQERLDVIAARLPEHRWPDRDLRVTAVDAETGEFRLLDRHSGVPLVTAVAASCAVPGVYPPVTVAGRRMVDGGVNSGSNADVAAGAASIVVLAPSPRGIGPMTGVGVQVEQLRADGARVVLVSPDAAALIAIGKNVLDPAARAPAAQAGRAQAAAVLDEVRFVWSHRPPPEGTDP